MLKEDDPVVRRVIFLVRSHLKYDLDTNNTTNIKMLKKHITKCAKLKRNSFQLIGFYDDKDYTFEDDKKLEELFPGEKDIVFKMQIKEPEELEALETSIDEEECWNDSRIDMFCSIHTLKYKNLFCFTCGISICSECASLPEHAGHEKKDKLDYFNDTKILVDEAFAKNQYVDADLKLFAQRNDLMDFSKSNTIKQYFDR